MSKILPIHLQIRAKRRELDIKQEGLADLSDLSVSFISQLERGRYKDLGLESLRKISGALNFYEWDLNLMNIQL